MILSCKRAPTDSIKSLVNSTPFNVVVIAQILVAAITVGLSTYPDLMAEWGRLLHTVDLIIIAFFTFEVALRIIAEYPRFWVYFRDIWNIFDSAIVIMCLVPFENDAVIVLRLVRLLRVMRIFRALPRLRLLIRGIAHSISSVGYVVALLTLHFYIFAIIGVSAFARTDLDHFGSLGKAFLTLFQVLTLENWPDVMAPVKATYPVFGVIYFVLFIVTGTMVAMNLFVGVIVGGMSEAIQEKKNQIVDETSREINFAHIRSVLSEMEAEIAKINTHLRQFTASKKENNEPFQETR